MAYVAIAVAEDYKQDCGMSIFRLHVAISFFFESFKWQLVIRSHLEPVTFGPIIQKIPRSDAIAIGSVWLPG